MTKVRVLHYDMRQFFSACVTTYLKLTGKDESVLQRPAPTPYLADDDKEYDDSAEPKGELTSIAAKVIMKILYGARMARYDLLHSCQILACKITKWTKRCDQRLHRIISYIHQNNEICMFGWVGDKSDDWKLWLYTDADFAADKSTSRSVSGVFCAMSGPTTYFLSLIHI